MCFAPNRASLEARLLDGESVQHIAADLGVNASAVYRHIRNHLRTQLADALVGRGVGTHVADLAGRLQVLLAETEAVRDQARRTNDGRLLLQAVQVETATVTTLTQRLGIDHTDTVDDINEARALLRACLEVLPLYPDALRDVCQELDRIPAGDDLATVLRKQAQVVPSRQLALAAPIQQSKELP